jgi:hypothetical protein
MRKRLAQRRQNADAATVARRIGAESPTPRLSCGGRMPLQRRAGERTKKYSWFSPPHKKGFDFLQEWVYNETKFKD